MTATTTTLHPQRLALRFELGSRIADLEPAIGVFHRCLQRGWLEGQLIDVADYRHVPQGPGVMVVGHDIDYSLTHDALTVTRKRSSGDDAATQTRDLLRAASVFVEALTYDGTLTVDADLESADVALLDRALASQLEADGGDPSTAAAALADALRPAFEDAWGGEVDAASAPRPDPRSPMGVQAQTAGAVAPDEIIERLGGSQSPMQSPYDISVEAFAEQRGSDDVVVLDVREESEYSTVNLGGTLLPLAQLPDRLDELDRDATILVHCRAGIRGGKAVAILREAGFSDAWNVNGALVAWADRIDPDTVRY